MAIERLHTVTDDDAFVNQLPLLMPSQRIQDAHATMPTFQRIEGRPATSRVFSHIVIEPSLL